VNGPFLRPPRPGDAERIAALVNAHSVALGHPPDMTAALIEEWWAAPGADMTADAVVVESAGEVVGYGDLTVRGPQVRLDLGGEEPELVLDELELRASTRGSVARLVLHERDPVREVLDRRGYAAIRAAYDMETSLDDDPEPPVWPDGITPRRPESGDEPLFHLVQEEAFADHWGHEPRGYEEWAHLYGTMRPFDPDLWLLADAEGDETPAAIAICEGGREGDETTGWVHVLAVRRPWRRRGLGSALLRWSLGALRERGLATAALSVDAENTTGAVGLYERAGLRVTSRFEHWEKPLAPFGRAG
jgi:ribosomal protein S18 acetylase RimI-like enzyme